MNPIQPNSYSPHNPGHNPDPVDPTGSGRRRSSGSIQAAAATEVALTEIFENLQLLKGGFETYMEAGIKMADSLCKLASEKTDKQQVAKFNDSYAALKRIHDSFSPELQKSSEMLGDLVKNRHNINAYNNCESQLIENRQSEPVMNDWKKIADCMAQLKTSFIRQQIATDSLKLIETLPAEQRNSMRSKRLDLESQKKVHIRNDIKCHGELLAGVNTVLQKLAIPADSEVADAAAYKWSNNTQSRKCLESISAAVAALSASAYKIQSYVSQSSDATIKDCYTHVTEDGPADEQHAQNFNMLDGALQRKIFGYNLYEDTTNAVESCKALKAFWEKSGAETSSNSAGNPIEQQSIYNKFANITHTLVPQSKSQDLIHLLHAHQANARKVNNRCEELFGLASDADRVVLLRERDSAATSYRQHLRIAMPYIKGMIADGKVSESSLPDFKNQLGDGIVDLAKHQILQADGMFELMNTIAPELRRKPVLEPADAKGIAEPFLHFVRCIHDAAKALFDSVPNFENTKPIQDIATLRSELLRRIPGCGQCAEMINAAVLKRPELAGEIKNPNSPIAKAYAEIKFLVNDVEEMVKNPSASLTERIHFQTMHYAINQFETEVCIKAVKQHTAKPTKEFNEIVGHAIAHASNEMTRLFELANLTYNRVSELVAAQHNGDPIDEQELDQMRKSSNEFLKSATDMQTWVQHWHVIGMLHDHPHLMKYYNMVHSRFNGILQEMALLKERKSNAKPGDAATNTDTDSVSDTDLRLLSELSQLDSDLGFLLNKFKTKFNVSGPNRNVGYEPANGLLESIRITNQKLLRDATSLIGIDPSEVEAAIQGENDLIQMPPIQLDSVDDQLASEAHDAEMGRLTASVSAAQLSPPSPAQLDILRNEMDQRAKQVSDLLDSATGWTNFARELADDGANPAHVKKFFVTAADLQDQAAGFLDINEQLSKSVFSTPTSVRRDKGKSTTKPTAAETRALAKSTRLEGDGVFTRLTKSKALPFDGDVKFALDNRHIASVTIAKKESYTPKNASTGQVRVDHKNQEQVAWVKEIVISLKPDGKQTYPKWVVHLHYPNDTTEHFSVCHAKKYEDRKRGSSSGNIDRQYISHENVRRLLAWKPSV